MDSNDLAELAQQLGRPQGELGLRVAQAMQVSNARMHDRSHAALELSADMHVVEVGPGSGMLSEPVVRCLGAQGRYTALEYSRDMADLAATRLQGLSAAPVSIHCVDVSDPNLQVPVAAGSVDRLLAVNVVYFIDDLDSFLGRVAAWLRPGGMCVLGVRSREVLCQLPFTRFGFRIRSLDTYLTALGRAGFREIAAFYEDEGPTDFDGMQFSLDAVVVRATRSRSG
ncbi:MAG: class I SAM-dependent methyltransferase [Myxococcota bacterium]